jgi:hypothetical protein
LVIVLRPAEVDELTQTALARVTGELTAARFQVTVVPLNPGEDPTLQVEGVAPESHAVAAFAIDHIADSNGDTIAIWVCDRLGRRTTIQRMAIRGKNVSQDAEVLALEAIELIRVSVAGLWSQPAASSGLTALPNAKASSAKPESPQIALGAGIAALRDFGVPSAQWMGSLAAVVSWDRHLGARLYLSGLGPAQTYSAALGSAAIHREIGALGPVWMLWTGGPVNLWLSLMAGVGHLAAVGSSPDPARSTHVADTWYALAAVGPGATIRLFSRVSVTANLDGVWTWPAVELRIDETRIGPFSRPGLLFNGGLLAGF